MTIEPAECDDCGTGVALGLVWEDNEPVMALMCDCGRAAPAAGFEVESVPNRWK